MIDQLDLIFRQLGISSETLMVSGISLGVLITIFGIASLLMKRNTAVERMSAITISTGRANRQNKGILKAPSKDPGAFMKSFIPVDQEERSALQLKLAQGGLTKPTALRNFTLLRVFLGLILPGTLLAIILVAKTPGMALPFGLSNYVLQLSSFQVFQLITVLVGAGYFLPMYWLNARVTERKRRIEEGFPNALDLMQISVETGLGFDSAMTRVGNELVNVSPEIAFEFLNVQLQVQAGRARDAAMHDMANRTGVETVRSFANVVQQSMQFGTSMSSALTTYANELRDYREMKAQEMANKLPVKMSAVLASLMLPALIMLTVGPVVIRYVRFYAG